MFKFDTVNPFTNPVKINRPSTFCRSYDIISIEDVLFKYSSKCKSIRDYTANSDYASIILDGLKTNTQSDKCYDCHYKCERYIKSTLDSSIKYGCSFRGFL